VKKIEKNDLVEVCAAGHFPASQQNRTSKGPICTIIIHKAGFFIATALDSCNGGEIRL